MMYRTHCQRILDTVIRANFDEVTEYICEITDNLLIEKYTTMLHILSLIKLISEFWVATSYFSCEINKNLQ